jgi:thioredoxin 1
MEVVMKRCMASIVLPVCLVLMIGPLLFAAAAEGEEEKESKIKVTFVELGSVKCIPCKKMQPVMKAIEKEYGDQVKVVFHDVWTSEGKPYAKKYKIRLIPTQVFLDKDGKEYFRHVGFFPKEEVVKVLKQKGVK